MRASWVRAWVRAGKWVARPPSLLRCCKRPCAGSRCVVPRVERRARTAPRSMPYVRASRSLSLTGRGAHARTRTPMRMHPHRWASMHWLLHSSTHSHTPRRRSRIRSPTTRQEGTRLRPVQGLGLAPLLAASRCPRRWQRQTAPESVWATTPPPQPAPAQPPSVTRQCPHRPPRTPSPRPWAADAITRTKRPLRSAIECITAVPPHHSA